MNVDERKKRSKAKKTKLDFLMRIPTMFRMGPKVTIVAHRHKFMHKGFSNPSWAPMDLILPILLNQSRMVLSFFLLFYSN